MASYTTPECATWQRFPAYPFHGKCFAPGYRHPVLGWVAVDCDCPCHSDSSGTTLPPPPEAVPGAVAVAEASPPRGA